jgi:hypothetical protein
MNQGKETRNVDLFREIVFFLLFVVSFFSLPPPALLRIELLCSALLRVRPVRQLRMVRVRQVRLRLLLLSSLRRGRRGIRRGGRGQLRQPVLLQLLLRGRLRHGRRLGLRQLRCRVDLHGRRRPRPAQLGDDRGLRALGFVVPRCCENRAGGLPVVGPPRVVDRAHGCRHG